MKKVYFIILLGVLFSAGCKKAEEPSAEGNSTDYKPVAEEECQAIATKLEGALKTKFSLTAEKSTELYPGKACYLKAEGNGTNFDIIKTPESISKTVGWESDISFAADGPTGTSSSLKNGNKLLTYAVNWEAPAGKCPDDRPISDCELKPEEQNYTIEIWLGQL